MAQTLSKKMIFWIEESRNVCRTYQNLVEDVARKTDVGRIVMEGDPYTLFVELVSSLVYGIDIDLLDSNLSVHELDSMGVTEKRLHMKEPIRATNRPRNIEEMHSFIRYSHEPWTISMYSSGTTGTPKRVSHNLASISKGVRCGRRFESNVWALAYNPTHFAGIQVFLQAFLNTNPMIYLFEEERSGIPDIIEKYHITNFSATPAFYRSFLPFMKKPSLSVKKLTVGGERFAPVLIPYFSRFFPNAEVKNIYASTEGGSLFTSDSDIFQVHDVFADHFKINPDGELLIHKSNLGEVDNSRLCGDWYPTGDIVEELKDGHFRFVSRKGDFINVGGYKVNPQEVEDEILKIDGVIDAVVKGRRNNVIGNLVVAEVRKVPSLCASSLEREILKELGRSLQPWKIPRIITFVDSIEMTRTGKKVRK